MSNKLIIIVYICLLNNYLINTKDSFDFRFLSYNESLENIHIYENGDQGFDAISIDQEKDQIIVGGKNVIIRLSLETFHLLERFEWESTANERNLCRNRIQTPNECENYIRVLALRSFDQSLLTCGTNSYHPICTWRRSDSLSTIISNENYVSGDGKSSYNSQYPSVYQLLDNGEFYSATINQPLFGVNDPLIQRSFSQTKQLRTQQHDSNWLKSPYFVRILNIGQYIYTFFREISLEHLSCGMNIYSRVARVCKYDDGTMKFSDTFRSFSKIRLLCSNKLMNQMNSFEFNELQSIYYHSQQNFIYGAFNLPKSGLVGSAICIYTVEQLENVFKSSFLTQKSNESYWLPSSTKQETEKCEPNSSDDMRLYSSGPVLRSGVLQSSFNTLIFDDIRIGHLLVDQLNDITILFIVTIDGLWLRKYSLLTNKNLCLLEQIPLKPPSIATDDWKVNKVELISKTKQILITTQISILKIPFSRCQRFNTSHLCSASMDPYCLWDNHYQRCIFSLSPSSKTFRQSFTCPVINITIDGGWTSWSSWFTCEQETNEKCQCRTRSCTEPTPQFNGKDCQGTNIQIKECQIHGGWSPWSSWSKCPQTCGKAYRTRTRTCTNPEAKNNGRICIGSDREEEPCPEIVCTNEIEWNICSKSCGGGIQKRKRLCLNNNNNEKCNECSDEIRICNDFPCPTQQATIWSNWTEIMLNDDIRTEMRTRFLCTISSGTDQQSIEIKSDKIMYRICQKHSNGCLETDTVDQWSLWSNWSECTPRCGTIGSVEIRRRQCLTNKCLGNDIEKRPCTNCFSESKSNWSCWTDWSDCQLCTSTNRLYSKKFRSRQCLTDSCDGLSYEERSCLCITSLNEYQFTYIHLIFISLISFLFGCLFIFFLYLLCRYRYRQKLNSKEQEDYFRGSTSNSSSSPHTAMDSEIFSTLDQEKFRNFDSSSILTTNQNKNSLKDIPSRKLNMYINPRDVKTLPLPPAATLKRTSFMSSMKTNLDAEDL